MVSTRRAINKALEKYTFSEIVNILKYRPYDEIYEALSLYCEDFSKAEIEVLKKSILSYDYEYNKKKTLISNLKPFGYEYKSVFDFDFYDDEVIEVDFDDYYNHIDD